MIAYASRTGTKRNLDLMRHYGWRVLVSATGVLRSEGFPYALDNGAWTAFAQGRPFDEAAFSAALRWMGANADWCVIPDVVAGGLVSLDLSLRWMRRVLDETSVGLLAVQDGMSVDDVRPFIGPRVGVFVGGSTAWKLQTMRQWADVARKAGAVCHVGRVNSCKRIALCHEAGVTSFDGTSASKFAITIPKLSHATQQQNMFTEKQ